MQVHAEIPHGMQPGQTFTLQTATGLYYPVVVPPGAAPGQQVLFTLPAQAAQPTTVVGRPVDGSVYPAPPQSAMQTEAGHAGASKPYRTNPLTATADGIPLMQGIPLERQEQKLSEIRRGGELAQENPPFPETRAVRDAPWALLFAALAVAMAAGTGYFGSSLLSGDEIRVSADDGRLIADSAYAGASGAGASLGAAMAYMWLASNAPACVVWTSLLFSPTLLIAGGVAVMFFGSTIFGLALVLLGALCLSCVFLCYRPLIPFMIKIVETVSKVIRSNPCTIAVSLIGSIAGIVWTAMCMVVFSGAFLMFKDKVEDAGSTAQYVVYFFAVLIFIVGGQVAYNVCHVTYCGVFGRWYFAKDREGGVLGKSLRVALATSFGSICCGAFLIAAIRALEAVIRSARRDAQESGNAACCVLLLVLECVVSCIGDILEYFSEWAFVQVAVRGTSFVQSARITYSMMTCANLLYVVQDLLINSVVNLGALLCGLVGGGVGAGVGFAIGDEYAALAGGVAGFLSGLLAGGAAAGIISSGTKTILVLWAESPSSLEASHPEIHNEFERRIYGKMAEQ